MPTQEYPQVHCVLEDDGVIYYSARGENGWTDYYEVSRDEGNNITITDCHHPSLVVEGDVVYVVWDGVLDGNRNIFWRHLTYFGEESFWSWIWLVCNTQNPSGYPILTTGFFCSWVERQGDDYEIYYARYEPPVWGWRGQTNLSNSPDKISRFSHLAHKQTEQGTDIYFIWTENSVPPYDIKFERVTIGGGGGSGPDALAGLPLYIAKGGEEEKSPFNTRRGGYIQYGNLPYQRVDIDSQYIEYRFENLDYKRDYDLVFCVYQHGYSNLPLFLKVDGVQVGVVNIPQDTLIIRRHRIPASIYADSVIQIEVSGNPAISGSFVLYEYERIRSKGGPQDKGTVGIGSRKSNFEVYPNPFNNNLTIKFQTPGLKSHNPNGNVGQGFLQEPMVLSEPEVSLAVYDVTGRMVKDFSRLTVNGERSTVVWVGCDDSGRRLSGGVYFVRLEAGDYKQIEKAVLLR